MMSGGWMDEEPALPALKEVVIKQENRPSLIASWGGTARGCRLLLLCFPEEITIGKKAQLVQAMGKVQTKNFNYTADQHLILREKERIITQILSRLINKERKRLEEKEWEKRGTKMYHVQVQIPTMK